MQKVSFKTKLLQKFVATAVVSLLLSVAATQSVQAAVGSGWRWIGQYAAVTNSTSTFGTAIASSISDYDLNTDLNVTSSQNGQIYILQNYYGVTTWSGLAIPYSSGNPCVDFNTTGSTGYCGYYIRRADFAYIYFNTGTASTSSKDWQVRHEMGHVFGLAHTCSPISVMNSVGCGSGSTYLRVDEITWINNAY